MLAKEDVEVPYFIDTLKVSRYLDENSLIPEHNLQYLRYHHELEIDAFAHDAESDVKVLEALFRKLYAIMFETIQDEEQVIKQMQHISTTPFLIKTFNFGKYKGRTVKDVYYADKKYLEWLLLEKETSTRDDEDWVFTLKHHLQIKN